MLDTISPAAWEQFLAAYPQAHVLQTPAWGALKADFGWRTLHVVAGAAGAQVLLRRLPLGMSVAYLPKGPVGDPAAWPDLWPRLDALCRRSRALFLKVEPDVWQGQAARPPGFSDSDEDIQPARTLVVDLSGSEDDVLGRMKQKTRYNIRLAMKKDIVAAPSSDIDAFHRMMLVTGARDGFAVHSRAYYQRAYDLFHPTGTCELLLAAYQGQPVAAVMVFRRGERAWYLYGASTGEQRERMPTYLLQWEAMRWARQGGCRFYDLWGVPDADESTLEAGFTGRAEGLWGVYRFKRGFGGHLLRAAGPWEKLYWPATVGAYRLAQRLISRSA